MNPQAFHGRSTITTQGASFNEVMLSNVFVLEMRAHGNLALKSSVADWAMIRQALCVGCEMFCQVIFSKESFLANTTFVRFDSSMPHFMPAHIGAIRELHVAHVALEQLSVRPGVGVLRRRHVVVVRRALRHVGGQCSTTQRTKAIACGTF